MSEEIYVSTDVEADGPIPGPHSMLSFGSAAYTADKQLIATFSANLETLPGAIAHPVQEAWWKTQPEAWAACRENLQSPESVMQRYVEWVEALPGKPVFVAFPAGFDFTFMFWYMMRFAGRCPYSWSALDIKTLAFALTGLPYRKSIKPRFPKHWFDEHPHTHVALDDAIEQGALFCNMLADLRAAGPLLRTAMGAAVEAGAAGAPAGASDTTDAPPAPATEAAEVTEVTEVTGRPKQPK